MTAARAAEHARGAAALAPERAVLKAGGAVVSDTDFLAALADHVAERVSAGGALILVHGGGELITELERRFGVSAAVKHQGLRATPPESMRLVAMALRGVINATIVARLVARGVAAIGVSGVDLGILRSDFLNRTRLGRVGGPPRVDATRLRGLLAQGLTPVLAPVCLGPDGGLLNVNADTVAHSVAVSLGVETLDFVSDVPGVLDAEGRVARRLDPGDASDMLRGTGVRGGMIPKLQAAVAAARAGVGRVRIGDLSSLSQGTATEVVA